MLVSFPPLRKMLQLSGSSSLISGPKWRTKKSNQRFHLSLARVKARRKRSAPGKQTHNTATSELGGVQACAFTTPCWYLLRSKKGPPLPKEGIDPRPDFLLATTHDLLRRFNSEARGTKEPASPFPPKEKREKTRLIISRMDRVFSGRPDETGRPP